MVRAAHKLELKAVPFSLDDLQRIRVRVGMGTKSLHEMSDTQFMAWLRAQGASGEIGIVKVSPGELMIPIEERVNVLNDLERAGFFIPDVMGKASSVAALDRTLLSGTLPHLNAATVHLIDVAASVSGLGCIDAQVNMRPSSYGAR